MLHSIDTNTLTKWSKLCRDENWDLLLDTVATAQQECCNHNLLRVAVRCRRVPVQVLRSLSRADPGWVACTNDLTGTLLHEAIQYGCQPDVQYYLMEEMKMYKKLGSRNLFHVQDGRGRTALHCLLQQQRPQQVGLCQYLWSICPSAACFLDCDGNSPLMLLLQQATLPDSQLLDMIRDSLSQWPVIASLAHTYKTPFRNPYSIPIEGVIQTIEFRTTPMYHAVLAGRSASILDVLVAVAGPPELSRLVTAHAEVALHVAVTTYTNDTHVLRVLAASPQSLAAKDVCGLTPIDWLWLAAIREWCTTPADVEWRTRVARRRYLPAPLAMWKRAIEQILPSSSHEYEFQQRYEERQAGLLKRFESLLQHHHSLSSWAHVVCSVRCPQALRKLVLRDGALFRQRDPATGRYPLHCAATQGPYWFNYRLDVFADRPYTEREPSPVLDVVARFPAACRKVDRAGQLPLHVAIDRNDADGEDLEELLRVYPAAICHRDGITKLYPCLQAAVGPKAQLNTIYCLLRFYPVILNQRK